MNISPAPTRASGIVRCLPRLELSTRPRLFCFPYAGGTPSVFRDWQAYVQTAAEIVPVLLPGRGMRSHEPPHEDMGPLVEEVISEIAPHTGQPFALFGHSMGALVAFETARALEALGRRPVHLFVSGCRPPELHGRERLHTLPAPELVEAVRRLARGRAEGCFVALVERRLPLLRADLRVCERYRHTPGARISTPVTAYGGWDDPIATPDEIEGWREYTTASCIRRVFPGEHFFIQGETRLRVLRALARDLEHVSLQSCGAP